MDEQQSDGETGEFDIEVVTSSSSGSFELHDDDGGDGGERAATDSSDGEHEERGAEKVTSQPLAGDPVAPGRHESQRVGCQPDTTRPRWQVRLNETGRESDKKCQGEEEQERAGGQFEGSNQDESRREEAEVDAHEDSLNPQDGQHGAQRAHSSEPREAPKECETLPSGEQSEATGEQQCELCPAAIEAAHAGESSEEHETKEEEEEEEEGEEDEGEEEEVERRIPLGEATEPEGGAKTSELTRDSAAPGHEDDLTSQQVVQGHKHESLKSLPLPPPPPLPPQVIDTNSTTPNAEAVGQSEVTPVESRLVSECIQCPDGWSVAPELAGSESVEREAPLEVAGAQQMDAPAACRPDNEAQSRAADGGEIELLVEGLAVAPWPSGVAELEVRPAEVQPEPEVRAEESQYHRVDISVLLNEVPDDAAQAGECALEVQLGSPSRLFGSPCDESSTASSVAEPSAASALSDTSQHSALNIHLGASHHGPPLAGGDLHYQQVRRSSSAHLLAACALEDEDLEREFDEEPEFEPRNVQVKRNQDPRDQYALGDELGRGKFGTVYRCVEEASGRALAAKFIHMRRREDREDVEREVAIMSVLQHKRLLQLYDAFDDGRQEMCLVTELVEGGELFERIVDDDFDLTEKKAAIFMRQICEGADYMHGQQIVHLDMKPENILCLSRTGIRIKLIDFGLARRLDPAKPIRVMFGTPDFAAPEVLAYETVSLATDMWSVGVICYVLLSGLSPFMGDNDMETMANVMRATFDFNDHAFEAISDLAKDFISRLLVRNAHERLKPAECLRHAWLARGGAPLEANIRSRRESSAVMISAHHRLALEQAAMAAALAAAAAAEQTPKPQTPPTPGQFAPGHQRVSFGAESSASSGGTYSLDKRRLKRYVVRRKWHKTVHAIMALGRMGANLRLAL